MWETSSATKRIGQKEERMQKKRKNKESVAGEKGNGCQRRVQLSEDSTQRRDEAGHHSDPAKWMGGSEKIVNELLRCAPLTRGREGGQEEKDERKGSVGETQEILHTNLQLEKIDGRITRGIEPGWRRGDILGPAAKITSKKSDQTGGERKPGGGGGSDKGRKTTSAHVGSAAMALEKSNRENDSRIGVRRISAEGGMNEGFDEKPGEVTS